MVLKCNSRNSLFGMNTFFPCYILLNRLKLQSAERACAAFITDPFYARCDSRCRKAEK